MNGSLQFEACAEVHTSTLLCDKRGCIPQLHTNNFARYAQVWLVEKPSARQLVKEPSVTQVIRTLLEEVAERDSSELFLLDMQQYQLYP
jgi:hypothetical protein